MGDAEPDVQKALAWAYRSLAQRDPAATTAALRRQTDLAAEHDDGHRAWVVRDSLAKLAPADADELRARLAGIRKRTRRPIDLPGGHDRPPGFGDLPDPITTPNPADLTTPRRRSSTP